MWQGPKTGKMRSVGLIAGSVLSQIYKKAVFHKRKGPWQEEIKSLFAKTLSVETSHNAFIASIGRSGL